MRFPSILILLLVLGTANLSAGDWPNWMGPNHNSISSESIPTDLSKARVLWKGKVGVGFSSVTVATFPVREIKQGRAVEREQPRAFTMGHNGRSGSNGEESVFCLDAGTGAVLWTHSYPAPLIDRFYEGGPGASVTIRDGRAYAYSKHGHLLCIDAAKGTLIWKKDMAGLAGIDIPEWGFACSPVFLDSDTVLIEAGRTYALRADDGEVEWKSGKFPPAYGSPVVFEGNDRRMVAVLKTSGLVVLDGNTGGTIATTSWETSFDTNATTPIQKVNLLFVSTGYARGCGLFELKDGRLVKRYENEIMSNHMNQSVLIDGHLYGFDGTAHRGPKSSFVCMALATGKESWRLSARSGLGCGSLIGTMDGTLLLFSERGELVTMKADPKEARILNRRQVLGGRCWTPPTLSGGHVFVRNARGDVACVALK